MQVVHRKRDACDDAAIWLRSMHDVITYAKRAGEYPDAMPLYCRYMYSRPLSTFETASIHQLEAFHSSAKSFVLISLMVIIACILVISRNISLAFYNHCPFSVLRNKGRVIAYYTCTRQYHLLTINRQYIEHYEFKPYFLSVFDAPNSSLLIPRKQKILCKGLQLSLFCVMIRNSK